MPPYLPTDVIASFESNHDTLTKKCIIPLCVFDGFHHAIKAATIAECTDARNKARDSLHSFYERGNDPNVIIKDEDCSSAMKNVKIIASRTNELTNLVKG